MEKKILHIDVNSAFLSWSALKLLKEDPTAVDLRTIPSAVGGDVKTRHDIITARSLPAKEYGIKTAEPVVKALQKCPGLVLVQGDFATYHEYSSKFIEILFNYSELVEQVSIDEAFVDISDFCMDDMEAHLTTPVDGTTDISTLKENDRALATAAMIKDEIRDTLGFTVNVGISSNKLLAKMASDFRKPDRLHTLYPEEIKVKMWGHPIGDLFGCGKNTAEKLKSLGIMTIGDAANTDLQVLIGYLGSNAGEYIYAAANGIGGDEVHSEHEAAKSYSNETTTSEDITGEKFAELAYPLIKHLSEKVSKRMKRDDIKGYTVRVMVKTNTFGRHSRQTKLISPTNDARVIERTARELLEKLSFGDEGILNEEGLGYRLIGVGVADLDYESEYEQMDIFGFMEDKKSDEKQAKLDAMMKSINDRFGKGKVKRGKE